MLIPDRFNRMSLELLEVLCDVPGPEIRGQALAEIERRKREGLHPVTADTPTFLFQVDNEDHTVAFAVKVKATDRAEAEVIVAHELERHQASGPSVTFPPFDPRVETIDLVFRVPLMREQGFRGFTVKQVG